MCCSVSYSQGRIRHSIKRRPPSRQIRKSSGDEVGTEEEKVTSPVSGQTNPDITENDVFEKQKEPKEETDGVDPLSATFKQQQDQQQHEASADSEQQFLSSTGDEEESRECVVSAEQEEKVEEKKMSEQPELDSSKEESLKQEVQSEPVTATEDKIEEEVKGESLPVFLIGIPAHLFLDVYLNRCLCFSHYRNVNALRKREKKICLKDSSVNPSHMGEQQG